MKNLAPEKAVWMVVQEKCVPRTSIAATNMFVWMQMKLREPVCHPGVRNKANIATMTRTVNRDSFAWAQAHEEPVSHPTREIKFLAKNAEPVANAMAVKVFVASL